MADKTKVNTTIRLENVRGCYLHLFKPYKRPNPGGAPPAEGDSPPKYSALFLLNKTTQADQIKKIQDLIAELLRKPDGSPGKLPADKLCMRDGDERDEPEFAGMMMISASNALKTPVVPGNKDASGKFTPIPDNDSRIFSGCYFNAGIRLWKQENSFGKRVNAELVGVQYLRPGEPLGNVQVAPEKLFDEVTQEVDDLLG